MLAVPAMMAAVLGVAACSGGTVTPEMVAQDMKNADWSGAKVSHLECRHRAAHYFTCRADYRATRQSARASATSAGLDPDSWTPGQWDAAIAAHTGRVTMEITADSSGGQLTRYSFERD